MKIQEVKSLLPVLYRNKITGCLWGAQGVGKTQTVAQAAKEQNLNFIKLNLATQEVGDLIGLLMKADDGTVYHARPNWFPTSGKGIIFCDEWNRAHPDVLQAMFPFFLEGQLHQHKLPEGWWVVIAGNYDNSGFNVTDTSDAALISRFCHIDFTPSREEFIAYAEQQGADEVAEFIARHPEMLEVPTKDKPVFDMIKPNRRSWLDMVGRLESESAIDSIRFDVYAGIVGKTAAAAFMTDKAKAVTRISGKKILTNYTKIREEVLKLFSEKEIRFDVLNSAAEELLVHLDGQQISSTQLSNFKQFLLDIPLEMGLKVFDKLKTLNFAQKNEILNNKEFVEMFKSYKYAESIVDDETVAKKPRKKKEA